MPDVTIDNLVPQWKKPKSSNVMSHRYLTLDLTYCLLLLSFIIELGDAFSRSAFRQPFTVLHVVLLPYSKLPNGFCIFPSSQKPPYSAWPSASYPFWCHLFRVHFRFSPSRFIQVCTLFTRHSSIMKFICQRLTSKDILQPWYLLKTSDTYWHLPPSYNRILRLNYALLVILNADHSAEQYSRQSAGNYIHC